MPQKPLVDLTKMSPPEFAQYVMQADVGERMVYMRKRQGESTPLKREALYLYEGGYVLLTQRRCEKPNDKEFEYIATRTKKAAKKAAA